MAKAKKQKASAVSVPQTVIRVVTAVLLILGALTMGIVNLLFKDEFFEDINVSEIFAQGIGAVLAAELTPQSFLIGTVVFIAVSLVFCLILKLAANEKATVGGQIKTIIWLAVVALGLRCAALLAWDMPQTSDFLANYELSELLTTIPVGYWGRFLHELGTEYTGVWSAHMPFILYQAVALKCGISPGLLNAFYGTGTCIFAALLAKELFGGRAFATAMMFMALNPLAVLYTSILSNQYPAAMLLTAAVWIAVKYKNFGGAAAAGLVLGAGQILRPEMYPAAIGMLIYFIILRIRGDRRAAARAVVFATVFAAAVLACDMAMRSAGLISGHIYEGNMQYKLCVGLNKETRGGWSEADSLLINDPELLSETLRQRLTESGNLFLMLQKVVFQFGSYMYTWIMDAAAHPMFSNIICRRAVSAYMIIISVVAAVRLLKDKENKLFPVCIIIFGYMAAYAFIEIQPRYNFTLIPLLAAAAADIRMTDNKKM